MNPDPSAPSTGAVLMTLALLAAATTIFVATVSITPKRLTNPYTSRNTRRRARGRTSAA